MGDNLNHHWFRKLVTGKPHFIIGPLDEPYLIRRYIVPRNKFLNIYLHKFMRSDDDRALHDHPWPWMSIVLKGGYWEHRPDQLITSRSWRRPGSVALRGAGSPHRVELASHKEPRPNDYEHWFKSTQPPLDVYQPPGVYTIDLSNYAPIVEEPCWTLFVTGPKVREWGFHCEKAWVHWQEFTTGKNGSEVGKGCGEYA